jgi:redox-sensitive bicupin YhaK (pirin superfamily)
MIEVRPFASLGHAEHGWLDARHHFSFAGYHDRTRMGWGAIRVWNDDTIAANSGFAPHSHADMEIITFVRTGAISHEDSLGNNGRTAAGDVQVMSAGTGITHAEYNREDVPTTLFQIWVEPDSAGERPGWGARAFPRGDRSGRWVTLAAGGAGRAANDADGAAQGDVLPLRADARVLAANLPAGERLTFAADPARHLYLVAPTGTLSINGVAVAARDGVAITGERDLEISAAQDSEIVLVDAR